MQFFPSPVTFYLFAEKVTDVVLIGSCY